ncbi:MAG TPA: cellulase family glycosylhydrolase, partial [Roseiflexaceae bacterium]|nr:cellulase family glycosylhydrolase [Roseiflexaceae bacterium]
MLRIDGPWFKDSDGRTLLLRGVNVGGSSKLPTRPDGATYRRAGFFEHRDVSFVGRPFPLDEAKEHFARLRSWGFTFIRFLVTWEAIEHAGPGMYDQEYLDYLYAIVEQAGEHGISVLIDPHQDVWSRFSGGAGAPGWTFEAIGMEMANFSTTGAAIVHAIHGDPFPRMIWPTNANKLAAATMYTLFFGGNCFAPATQIEREPVQEYLQRHYIAAIQQVALRLRDLPNVVGYGTINEPHSGFIGHTNLHIAEGLLAAGERPSPWQAIQLGAGFPQVVDLWKITLAGPRKAGSRLVNAERARAWGEGVECVWRQNGVWDVAADGTPTLCRPEHFSRIDGHAVDFDQDFLRPFVNRFAQAIRAADPRVLIFVETVVGNVPPRWGSEDAPSIVYAPHWYDLLVLFTKRFSPLLALDGLARRPAIGPRRIRAAFAGHIASYQREARERLGGVPTLIGEFGIPFDLNGRRAFRSGDYTVQSQALDRSFRAIEDTLAHATLWNYTSDNSNARGDMWNDEDLSIFSRDQQADPSDLNSGGRALDVAVRPYPRRTAGQPLRMSFDYRRRVFEYSFRHDPAVTAPTELFMPQLQYPNGYHVTVSDGTYAIDSEGQTLRYWHSDALEVHTIRCAPLKVSR